MPENRRAISPEQKAKIALETIYEVVTENELTAKYKSPSESDFQVKEVHRPIFLSFGRSPKRDTTTWRSESIKRLFDEFDRQD